MADVIPNSQRAAAAADAIAAYAGASEPVQIQDRLAQLLCDLRHHADEHGVDFAQALSVSERAYTEQRLQEEGPFQAGCHTYPGAFLDPSPAASPFQPVATGQGVVTSINDAEWLLVCTAARLHHLERKGHAALAMPDDVSDRRALSEVLADACGLTPPDILRRLAPRIIERAEAIEHAAADAAEMGREHGVAGVAPYCRLDQDGQDSRLMDAFGETEPTTNANAMHRLALVQAYATAYRDARKQTGVTPTQLAERDYPQEPDEPAGRNVPPPSADTVRATSHPAARRPRKQP